MFKPDHLRKKRIISIFLSLVFLLGILCGNSAVYAANTEAVGTIEIQSTDYAQNSPASWHIDKSAHWTGYGTAEVNFDVNTVLKAGNENKKDVILILDSSVSMNGEKSDQVKNDANELITALLSDNENRVALIRFESEAELLTTDGFTNDLEELKEKVNGLEAGGQTNYYAALVKAEDALEGYQKEDGRDLIVLFLTDGYPSEDTNLEVGEYRKLKSLYPFMKVAGIQYELGEAIAQEIKNISDEQYCSDRDTLRSALFAATFDSEKYQNFQVVDYIDLDYFELTSADDVTASCGKVQVEEDENQNYYKVIWDLGDFYAGDCSNMCISLKLKDGVSETSDFFPTNTGEDVTVNNIQTHSDETPVLGKYTVHYNANKPDAASGSETNWEKHLASDNVVKAWPQAENDSDYLFKGWRFVDPTPQDTTDVFQRCDNFIMPDSDVYLKGTWGKFRIEKSMAGAIGQDAAGEDAAIENGTKVGTDQEITYYIDIYYDGRDEDENQTNTEDINSGDVTANVHSGYISVEDKIPDGMEFVGFGESENAIGAVLNDIQSCHGYVIDDNDGETGWDGGNENYSAANGLHYNAGDRTVRFRVNSLQAGGKLTVSVVVKTPVNVDDPDTPEMETRRDFYNYATAQEGSMGKSSNMVHLYMGEGDPAVYTVDYEYIGTVPSGASPLPASEAHAPEDMVSIADGAAAPEGYVFNGWELVSLEPVEINNRQFSMPTGKVKLIGRFLPDTSSSPKVTYVIDGEKPDNYEPPEEKNYYEYNKVIMDSLKAGDMIADYAFQGWSVQTDGVTLEEEEETGEQFFTMPGVDVEIKGSFQRISYTVSYEFYDTDPYRPETAADILSDANLQQTAHYENDTIAVATDPITAGTVVEDSQGKHKFLGWDKGDGFTMPASNIVIRGEWLLIPGVFEPQINKEIVNEKSSYKAGEVVAFKITVTNPHDFAITDITISENGKAGFQSGESYEVVGDHLAEIESIPANGSIVLYANYVVAENDSGTIENEVEFVSGIGENGYVLADGEYKATCTFKVDSEKETDPDNPEGETEGTEGETSGAEEESGEAESSGVSPKTGDGTNIYLFVIIAFLSFLCIFMVSMLGIPFKKKK